MSFIEEYHTLLTIIVYGVPIIVVAIILIMNS